MDRILICGTNWLGDSIMGMPAVQAFRRAHPDARIAVLVRPGLIPLWRMHAAPAEVLCMADGPLGPLRAAPLVRRGAFDTAFVFPHSFRSALAPYLGGVPARIGMPGHSRDWMLTQVIEPPSRADRQHQAYEYIGLMTGDLDAPLDPPRLELPEEAVAGACARLSGLPSPRIGLVPGAGRGPSKRWPEEHFGELGRRLAGEAACGVVVLGAPDERDLCGRVAGAAGGTALSLAGQTGLTELAAVLRACDAVVVNDSGAMHLAAAVGTPLVALYGMTDPGKTGPLGRRCVILQEGGPRSRDIARRSREAQERLASITPGRVYDAVLGCLGRGDPGTEER